jgi:hypothetical protein
LGVLLEGSQPGLQPAHERIGAWQAIWIGYRLIIPLLSSFKITFAEDMHCDF